jgi:carboxypeptidase C (cathepsin A)
VFENLSLSLEARVDVVSSVFRGTCLIAGSLILMALPIHAQSDSAGDASRKSEDSKSAKEKTDEPREILVDTQHEATIDGQTVKYKATAGKLLMKNDALKSRAEMFFVAYTRTESDPGKRPITFCFNGGPGSSSVWLHLGMLGPQRIRFPDDASYLKPPFALTPNPWSLLDVTDLVFIDPVSTGFSRPVNDTSKSEFHGYEEDVDSVGQFIHDYTTRFQRWLSPKFLCGESYGGVRAAGLSGHLQDRYNMELNGIVVISGAVNFQTLRFSTSNDLPNVLFLPTYTATAWYHKALPADLQPRPLPDLVAEAEAFARGEYAQALLKGTAIGDAEFQAVAEKMSRLTGLSADYIKSARLRVSMGRFGKELLRDRELTIGRFDSRYTNRDRDSAGETAEFDASGAAIFGPFTATFNDYVRRELKFEEERVYEILTGNVQPWSYRGFENRFVDASETLRHAMTANPSLKYFAACGYYDLATPHSAMNYTVDHLGLARELLPNVTLRYYEGGHMMYIHEPSLIQLRQDLLQFYQQAVPGVPQG